MRIRLHSPQKMTFIWAAVAVTTAGSCFSTSDVAVPGLRDGVAGGETQTGGYPTGEATDVYRAALDMLYTDGDERPKVIVMMDTVQPRVMGPCPQCPGPWKHKSEMDTATLLAYAGPPYGIPPIRPFTYTIPIRLLSFDDLREMARAGEEFAAAHPGTDPADPDRPSENALVAEFRRRFPEAWGWVQFTVVGFNPARSEALLGIHQNCGEGCFAREMVFFRKIKGKWTPVERIPAEASGGTSLGNLRYRGPALRNPAESELLTDRPPTSREDRAVYRAVLDSLYSFHGERPGIIVIGDQRVAGTTTQVSKPWDPAPVPGYRFFAGISDPLPRDLGLRLPVAFLTLEGERILHRDGPALERSLMEKPDGEEGTGFWRAFRLHYPQAWGYVQLSRVGYDTTGRKAIVYARHRCGFNCESGDTWHLTRNGAQWSIAARIPREQSAGWYLDSLRYLGRSARREWYKPGRARGIFHNVATGSVLRNFDVMVYHNERPYRTLRTDDAGRYSIELPRFGSIYWKTLCPAPHRDTLHARDFPIRPGLDTTLNVELEPRMCLRLDRRHPLIAGDRRAASPSASTIPPQVAAVYRGVLDFLYPKDDSARVLVQQFSAYSCDECVEREMPRLLRKRMIQSSTEANFLGAKGAGPPRAFPYRRKVEVFPVEDAQFLRGATDFWDVMKDAYPGVRAIISFSKVGFDDEGTEALVEFHVDQAGEKTGPEVMLLRKSGAEWRVALRHVNRPATSGEWGIGQCVPGDAPARGPTLPETRTLVGTHMIVRVHATRARRGSADTVWVRLTPLRPLPRRRPEYSSEARVLDARGREQPKIRATLIASDSGASVTFQTRLPEGVIETHGWFAYHAILRVDQGNLFGTWSSSSGMTRADEGYFCARRIRVPSQR